MKAKSGRRYWTGTSRVQPKGVTQYDLLPLKVYSACTSRSHSRTVLPIPSVDVAATWGPFTRSWWCTPAGRDDLNLLYQPPPFSVCLYPRFPPCCTWFSWFGTPEYGTRRDPQSWDLSPGFDCSNKIHVITRWRNTTEAAILLRDQRKIVAHWPLKPLRAINYWTHRYATSTWQTWLPL